MTLTHIPHRPLVALDRDVPWFRLEWQKLWLATQEHQWRSLALVPAGAGAPADFTLSLSEILARTGMMHRGIPIRVVDGTRVAIGQLLDFAAEVDRNVSFGDLVIIAAPAARNSPVAVPVAKTAHVALLCVLLGKMTTSDAQKTVDLIGRRRFIGTTIVRPIEPMK